MKPIFFINGKRGFQTLTVLQPLIQESLVVLPEGPENDDIMSYCRESGIGILFRAQDEPITLPMGQYDTIICSNFNREIFPEEIEAVNGNAINIHAGVIPEYAGFDADIWALINGEKELGITIHQLGDNFFDGKILAQEKFMIEDNMWIEDIEAIYLKTLENLLEGWAKNQLFDRTFEDGETYFWRERKPVDSFLNWRLSAKDVFNFIRALSQQSFHAFSYYNDNKFIFRKVKLSDLTSKDKPGTVLSEGNTRFIVCGDSYLVKVLEYDYTEDELEKGMILH